jgi:hypothetical protein
LIAPRQEKRIGIDKKSRDVPVAKRRKDHVDLRFGSRFQETD